MIEFRKFRKKRELWGLFKLVACGPHRAAPSYISMIKNVLLVAKFKNPENTHKLYISRLSWERERSAIVGIHFHLSTISFSGWRLLSLDEAFKTHFPQTLPFHIVMHSCYPPFLVSIWAGTPTTFYKCRSEGLEQWLWELIQPSFLSCCVNISPII